MKNKLKIKMRKLSIKCKKIINQKEMNTFLLKAFPLIEKSLLFVKHYSFFEFSFNSTLKNIFR